MELTMRNSMPTSNNEKSSTGPNKRARRSSPVRLSRPPSPEPNSNVNIPQQQFNYLSGLSNRQRVDVVLSRLYGEHRWTIKDLIYHMVMEEQERNYPASTKKRARDISKAIFDEPEVVDALSRASHHLRDHQILN